MQVSSTDESAFAACFAIRESCGGAVSASKRGMTNSCVVIDVAILECGAIDANADVASTACLILPCLSSNGEYEFQHEPTLFAHTEFEAAAPTATARMASKTRCAVFARLIALSGSNAASSRDPLPDKGPLPLPPSISGKNTPPMTLSLSPRFTRAVSKDAAALRNSFRSGSESHFSFSFSRSRSVPNSFCATSAVRSETHNSLRFANLDAHFPLTIGKTKCQSCMGKQ